MKDRIPHLHTNDVMEYLATADRRIVSGFRFALELLDLELPEAARARPTGPRRGKAVLADYYANHPVEAVQDRRRKIDAGVAASHAARVARENRNA